jgi:hypothetical protein
MPTLSQGNSDYVVPQYKQAIHVLQNLKTYGMGNGQTVPEPAGVSAKA